MTTTPGLSEDYPVLAYVAEELHPDGTAICGDSACSCQLVPEADRALAELAGLRKDVANLLTWKAEASQVLSEWEQVWQVLDRPGPLGESKARNVWRTVVAMRNRPAENTLAEERARRRR